MNLKFPILLILFISADLVFIALHIVFLESHWLSTTNFSIELDRGYGETFGFIKEFWITLVFATLAIRKRTLFYGFLSIFFLYLLLDDSLMIHEACGERLNIYLSLSSLFGRGGHDAGECIFLSLIGLIFLVPVFLAYSKSPWDLKWDARPLFPMIVALIFFGGVMDLIHALVGTHPLWEKVFGVLEDGGELLTLSVITWFVLTLSDRISVERITQTKECRGPC